MSKEKKYLLPEIERNSLYLSQPSEIRELIDFLRTVSPIFELGKISENSCCRKCGRKGNLHRHHKVAILLGYRIGLTRKQLHHPSNVKILCKDCHSITYGAGGKEVSTQRFGDEGLSVSFGSSHRQGGCAQHTACRENGFHYSPASPSLQVAVKLLEEGMDFPHSNT